MTIHRTHNQVLVECDYCGEIFDTEKTDFNEAVELLRKEGWTTRKLAGEWQHACLECKEDIEAL